MRARSFGTTGCTLPVVGQGTWRMDDTPEASVAALGRGLDLGLTIVDTAEMYGNGRVEELVGQALEGRREDAYLVSKVLPSNASRTGTVAACERSLERLGTDHMDLYLLHWPGAHPLEETVAAFEQLVDDGKVLAWGVSNFDVPELEQLMAVAGPGRIATNQVLHHVRERAIEHRVAPFCREHGIAVMSYSPLGQGDFPASGEPARELLARIGAEHGADAHQVALAFLLSDPAVFVIPKTATLAHVESNAAAGDLVLDAAELAAIDAALPRGPRPRSLPML